MFIVAVVFVLGVCSMGSGPDHLIPPAAADTSSLAFVGHRSLAALSTLSTFIVVIYYYDNTLCTVVRLKDRNDRFFVLLFFFNFLKGS